MTLCLRRDRLEEDQAVLCDILVGATPKNGQSWSKHDYITKLLNDIMLPFPKGMAIKHYYASGILDSVANIIIGVGITKSEN